MPRGVFHIHWCFLTDSMKMSLSNPEGSMLMMHKQNTTQTPKHKHNTTLKTKHSRRAAAERPRQLSFVCTPPPPYWYCFIAAGGMCRDDTWRHRRGEAVPGGSQRHSTTLDDTAAASLPQIARVYCSTCLCGPLHRAATPLRCRCGVVTTKVARVYPV